MSTMADLVSEVRSMAGQSASDLLNVLDAPYVPGDAEITFRYPSDTVAPGMTVCAGLTTFYVLDISPLVRQAKVLVSPNGEPDLPVPAGERVRIRPRFTDHLIFTRLNQQIRELTSAIHGLFTPLAWNPGPPVGHGVYPIEASIAARIYDIAMVQYAPQHDATPRAWPGWYLSRIDGGLAVRIIDEEGETQGAELLFTGMQQFRPATALSDDLELTCQLGANFHDIPVLGTLADLTAGTEVRRNRIDAQTDTRRPEEVPATANSTSSSQWYRLRQNRINAEYARLMQAYPPTQGRW